jgi:hypothetical protein
MQMDLHDQELLDRQLRNLHVPPRRDGVVIAAILAVFFGGILVGSLLSEPLEPTRTAANEPIASVPNGASATTQQ